MVKILLDSWAWIEFLGKATHAKKIIEQINKATEVVTTCINLHECGFKILINEDQEKSEKIVREIKEKATVLDIDSKAALFAIELRKKYGLHTSDSLCYATALINDASLVTGDPDFKNLPKVIFIE